MTVSTTYRGDLIAASLLVATFAAYLALDLTRRAVRHDRDHYWLWICLGSVTMGLGIWSMHFIGMLALKLGMPVRYEPRLLTISILAAIFGSLVALRLVSRDEDDTSPGTTVSGGAFLAVAIAAMHFAGMASMKMDAQVDYTLPLVVLSLIIGFSLSSVALFLAATSGSGAGGYLRRGGAALLLGLAVSGMHYMAMDAAHFAHQDVVMSMSSDGVGAGAVTTGLVIAAFGLLLVLLVSAGIDQNRASLIGDLRQMALIVRGLGRRGDTRQQICDAACELTGAVFAIICEASSDRRLHASTARGLEANAIPAEALGIDSIAGGVLATGRRVFHSDISRISGLVQATIADTGARSIAWEPILLDNEPIGVLILGWEHSVRHQSDRESILTRLLAAEAAVAIERADLLDRLESMALTDQLTGLANRRALDEEMRRAMAAARRNGDSLSVAMLDLDRFKSFNDTHGHLAGDQLLRESAIGFAGQLRGGDVVGRWGGEEFLALVVGADDDAVPSIVERLRRALPDTVTCSAGIATWNGTETAEDLIGRCDRALYRAKDTGRDRAVLDVLMV